MTRDFPAGNYRFIPAVFQYSSGAAADSGFEIERVRFDRSGPAGRRVCAGCEIYPVRRPAADVVLRLRAAFARGVYRGRVSNLQRALREDARGMGPVRWRHQSGGAQQRLPGDRSAGRAVIFCILLHPAEPGADADLRHRRRRRSARRGRQLSRADRALSRPQPGWTEGEGSLHGWRNGEPARRVRVRLEGHHGGAGLHRARLPPGHSAENWSATVPRDPA